MKLRFLLLLLLLPVWAISAYAALAPCSGSICYVDPASSGGNGTTTATSGANAAFATIATVNGYTYAAGTQILFKRGGTWAEQLTVSSSGSEGSLITFGAYGTGEPPIITGGTRAFDSNSKNYLRITGIHFSQKAVRFSTSTNTTIDYCLIDNSATNGLETSGTTSITANNLIVVGNGTNGVVAGAAGQSIAIKNSIVIGNGSYGLYATAGGAITYTNCLITGNSNTVANNMSGATDGGNNIVQQYSKITAHPKNQSYWVITSDDDDVSYWNSIASTLAPYGGHFTAFVIPLLIAADEEYDLATLASSGNEVAVHSWTHSNLAAASLFTVTSTNTNPTVNVDTANSQIILNCDEAGNRVTFSWASGKTIANLKTAVAGKGWTITTTTQVSDSVKLSGATDSTGANACPYAVVPSSQYWANEIGDTVTWITTKTGVAPTTMSYPYGSQSAGLQSWVQASSGLLAARGTGLTPKPTLPSLNVYNFPVLAASGFSLADEATARTYVRHMYEWTKGFGIVWIINAHSATELSLATIGYIADELNKLGGNFVTFKSAVDVIRADHSTADNLTYTKSYSDALNGHLLSGSPAINAGTDVSLTLDIEGKTVPSGSAPEIGAYEYQPSGGIGSGAPYKPYGPY